MASGDSDLELAREVVSRYQASRARSRRFAAVRAVLVEALHAPEPTSLLAVALKAGFKHERSLQAYDAEACTTIDDRYQAMQDSQEQSSTADSIPIAHIEQVLAVALRQDRSSASRVKRVALTP
jgi:hypothetical protein